MNSALYHIYSITNLTNGRVYIGLTKQALHTRIAKHRQQLRDGCHRNIHMQKDWNEGNFSFTYNVLGSTSNQQEAKDIEKSLMNMLFETYNIRKGNPGDMNGFSKGCSKSRRVYIYDEIICLSKCYGYTPKRLMEIFQVSHPLISMVLHGHRTTDAPQTSFGNLASCEQTLPKANNPRPSKYVDLYKEAV